MNASILLTACIVFPVASSVFGAYAGRADWGFWRFLATVTACAVVGWAITLFLASHF